MRYEKNTGTETIAVGWDAPMNTFFAQVLTNQADDDLRDLPPVLWLGGDFNEYTDFSEFISALAEHGYEIEAVVAVQLCDDRDGGFSDSRQPLEDHGWKTRK